MQTNALSERPPNLRLLRATMRHAGCAAAAQASGGSDRVPSHPGSARHRGEAERGCCGLRLSTGNVVVAVPQLLAQLR